MSSSETGALNEMRACVYLMTQGYDVFRALSPAAPFDLVAHRAGEMLRVEVKTGRTHRERDRIVDATTRRLMRRDCWDLLVIVFEDDCVPVFKDQYQPAPTTGPG